MVKIGRPENAPGWDRAYWDRQGKDDAIYEKIPILLEMDWFIETYKKIEFLINKELNILRENVKTKKIKFKKKITIKNSDVDRLCNRKIVYFITQLKISWTQKIGYLFDEILNIFDDKFDLDCLCELIMLIKIIKNEDDYNYRDDLTAHIFLPEVYEEEVNERRSKERLQNLESNPIYKKFKENA